MKTLLVGIALCAAGLSIAHATDRCTDAQWREALSTAPARDGSKLVIKPQLEFGGAAKSARGEPLPVSYTVLVYDAGKESYPLVCERRYTLAGLSQASLIADRRLKN